MQVRTVTLSQAKDALKAFGLTPFLWQTQAISNDRYQAMICDYSDMSGPTWLAIGLYDLAGNLLSRFNVLK